MADEKIGDEPMIKVVVTWGGHKLSPVQYNTVDVGQLSAEFMVPARQVAAGVQRMHEILRVEGEKLFEEKCREHADFLSRAVALVKGK